MGGRGVVEEFFSDGVLVEPVELVPAYLICHTPARRGQQPAHLVR